MRLIQLSFVAWLTLPSLLGCGQTSHHDGEGNAGAVGSGGRAEPSGGGGSVSAASGAGTSGGGEAMAGATNCEIVEIEDPAVEKAIRERLGLGPTAPLDGEVIAQMGGPIEFVEPTSLRGIECAISLSEIYTSGGKLDELSPLRALSGLKALRFDKTVISKVALRGSWFPPALRQLAFFGVDIGDLTPFTAASTVEVLVVSGGNVTDLSPLVDSTQVTGLGLQDNPLEDLTALGALTNLRALSVARTHVSSLDALSGLRLDELDISGSAVTSLKGVGAPRTPGQCAHVWAEEVPLSDESWAKERDQLCSLGWGVRASRPGDADEVTCGEWCDTR